MRPLAAYACMTLLLAGCSGLSPFGGSGGGERSRAPANAVAYQCEGGKRFHLRYLNNRESAWIIFPEREIRLDKVASGAGVRYSNAGMALEIAGDTASLNDGPNVAYTGCKTGRGA